MVDELWGKCWEVRQGRIGVTWHAWYTIAVKFITRPSETDYPAAPTTETSAFDIGLIDVVNGERKRGLRISSKFVYDFKYEIFASIVVKSAHDLWCTRFMRVIVFRYSLLRFKFLSNVN